MTNEGDMDFAASRRARGACPSCEMLNINGIPCHETGCPESWNQKRECNWCGSSFQPEDRNQDCCEQSCSCAYHGCRGCEYCEIDTDIDAPDSLEDDLGDENDPVWNEESIVAQVGNVISEEDPIAQVDKFNAKYPTPGVNNGLWWRMTSWREKMPQGYVAAPCSDCGHPVAKPGNLTESVACEFCVPPEIL